MKEDVTLTAFLQIILSEPQDVAWMKDLFSDDGKFALAALLALAED